MVWIIVPHPLICEEKGILLKQTIEEVRKRFSEAKVLVDMKIADIPDMNSKICKVLKELGADGVTIHEVPMSLDFDTHGLELFVLRKEEWLKI